MKISKLFHYLYACIMFLPLLVIPIFAINIINRSPEPISVTVDDTETTLDIQYKYVSNEVNTEDDLIIGNVYKFNFDTNNVPLTDFFAFDFYFLNGSITLTDSSGYDASLNDSTITSFKYGVDTSTPYFDFWLDDESYVELYYDNLVFYNCNIVLLNLYECGYNVNNYFTYTDFNVIESAQLVTTGTTTTYNDTDIGSQFVYSVYSVTDKYFNVTDLFGFDALQQWFIVNIFHGSVNLGFYIFWNLLTYWLFSSIFWLIFDVVIYVPQLVHRWLDKGVIE